MFIPNIGAVCLVPLTTFCKMIVETGYEVKWDVPVGSTKSDASSQRPADRKPYGGFTQTKPPLHSSMNRHNTEREFNTTTNQPKGKNTDISIQKSAKQCEKTEKCLKNTVAQNKNKQFLILYWCWTMQTQKHNSLNNNTPPGTMLLQWNVFSSEWHFTAILPRSISQEPFKY